MALIKCPHCGKPISDKAVKCPHCKKDVTFDTGNLKDEAESEIVAQSDVQSPQSRPIPTPNVAVQPKLQNAVGVKSSDNAKNSSKWLIILLAIIIILVAACVGYYFMTCNDNMGTPMDDNTEAVVDTVKTVETVDTLAVSDEVENPSEFVTLDLSAFLLHGKVKSVEESAGGKVSCTYYFSEQGELTKAVMSEGEYKCKIKRQSNKLILSFENPNDEFGGWGYVYTIDNSGRLISYTDVSEYCGNETTYSNFNSNDWPTRSKTIAENGGAVTISTMSYSQIDEYGNWTLQTSTDNEGYETTLYRSIEYYN